VLGAVLAGGESRRFGADKAAASIGGVTLLERAAGTLAGVFRDVVIVSAHERPTTPWPRVPDLRTGCGPAGGIEAALLHARASGHEGAFVLACDLPLVDETTVRAVLSSLGDSLAAVPVHDDGSRVEPLCAVYRVECLPVLARALDGGRYAARELLAAVGGVPVALSGAVFLNVNTPADHARAAAVLDRGAG
jgi:molybdopterin-guanine dinucleotide biosynthesis protein A